MNRKIKQIFIGFGAILLFPLTVFSCPVCEKQQPQILRGISHGAGPQSNWDLIIVLVTAVIVLVTLFFSVKWLIAPGEKSPAHIKYIVLTSDSDER